MLMPFFGVFAYENVFGTGVKMLHHVTRIAMLMGNFCDLTAQHGFLVFLDQLCFVAFFRMGVNPIEEAANQSLFIAGFAVRMLLNAAGGVPGHGDAGLAQVPEYICGNNQRQNQQNSRHPAMTLLSVLRFFQALFERIPQYNPLLSTE